MSVTTSNFHFSSNGWCNSASPMMIMAAASSSSSEQSVSVGNVDDGLTSLSWLQNLNMCMTRLGAPTPPTPPASPICSITSSIANSNMCNTLLASSIDLSHCSIIPKNIHSSFQTHREKPYHNGHSSNSKKSQSMDEEPIDYKTNGDVKPPYSYATLICMAMKANKNKMTLSAIYKWIRDNFLYYKNADPSWQNSIRHNLSLNKCFIKIPRNKDEPGKGGFWRLDPVYADTLVDGVFKKRRPTHRGNAGNSKNTSAPFKKKSRKKDLLRNGSSIGASINGATIVTNGIETAHILHDTPPNSAESYNPYGEPTSEVVELATAVSSIESVGHCPAYSYTMHAPHEHHLQHGYADEVCIAAASSDACMLSADGNDICWNAILTDADLGELVDPSNYAGPVVHSVDVSPTISDSTTTTAQLTAVEPHSLRLVASASSTANVLEDQELFHNGVRQLNQIAINAATVGTDVISATHNVVTCVNPTSVNTGDWGHWTAFPVSNHDNQSATTDLIIRHISANGEVISNGIVRPSITYLTTNATQRAHNGINHNCHQNTNSSTQPSSPGSANFDHQSALQPWAECKAALEAAALDLENFGDLDTVHAY